MTTSMNNIIPPSAHIQTVIKDEEYIITDQEVAEDHICPYCRSDNTYGMSRVVGYFSKIDNWNNSKKAELKRRQESDYWSEGL